MLPALLYQLVRYPTDLALVSTQSDAQLPAEVLPLRHQLRVLERKVGKPAWQPAGRLVLSALSRLLFPRRLRSGLQLEGVTVVRLPYQAPCANSIRFVGTTRRELLDHLLIFSARHLEAVIKECLIPLSPGAPSPGLEQRCPAPVPLCIGGQVVRPDRLGGLPHEYSRAA